MRAFLAIARNTVLETFRLPAFALVVIATVALYAVSPFLALFGFHDETRLLMDFGASTLVLAGWVLASLASGEVVRREIELGTTTSLLSKPVSRETLLGAKFVGVALALLIATALFGGALLLAVRQGAPSAHHHHGSTDLDGPVLVLGLGGWLLALLGAGARSYRGGRSFGAGACGLLVVATGATLLAAGFLDRHWEPQPFGRGFEPILLEAGLLAWLSLLVLAAFAVSLSVWLGRGATLVLTGLFWLGGLAAPALAREFGGPFRWLPDLRFAWVGEVFYGEAPSLPASYLLDSALYAAALAGGLLALGLCGLRRRSV